MTTSNDPGIGDSLAYAADDVPSLRAALAAAQEKIAHWRSEAQRIEASNAAFQRSADAWRERALAKESELAEAQAERDAARNALVKIAAGNPAAPGQWLTDIEMANIARAALLPDTAALTRAITQALKTDERTPVEVYAEVVQLERWAGLWGGLSIAERARVVEQAKREAGR